MDEDTLRAFDQIIQKDLPAKLVNFNTWIMDKYHKWAADKIGNEGSITAYADYLGIKYEVVRSWLKENGKTARDYRHVDALAKKYGVNVYHILGLTPPPPSIDMLPPVPKKQLLEALKEIEKQIGLRNLDVDSQEALELSAEIFSEHGIIVTEAKRSS